jgi:sugar phosphate isomerase/epimerase
MQPISFMSANYVSRVLGYHMTEGWEQGDAATNAYFRPVASFQARFEALLADIHALGFRAVDLWTAHLNPAWATPEHVETARSVLARYEMQVVSLAGYFGDSAEEVGAACRLARALGAPVLGGGTGLLAQDRARLVALLRDHGVRLGVENHPERTPQELLEKVGDADADCLGATVDTGWFGTQGYDAARALDVLGERVFHIHLKDIHAPAAGIRPGVTLQPGMTLRSVGHETCALGDGIVPVDACVHVLRRRGYTGAFTIEHEPEDHDPTAEIRTSLGRLRQWLA